MQTENENAASHTTKQSVNGTPNIGQNGSIVVSD